MMYCIKITFYLYKMIKPKFAFKGSWAVGCGTVLTLDLMCYGMLSRSIHLACWAQCHLIQMLKEKKKQTVHSCPIFIGFSCINYTYSLFPSGKLLKLTFVSHSGCWHLEGKVHPKIDTRGVLHKDDHSPFFYIGNDMLECILKMSLRYSSSRSDTAVNQYVCICIGCTSHWCMQLLSSFHGAKRITPSNFMLLTFQVEEERIKENQVTKLFFLSYISFVSLVILILFSSSTLSLDFLGFQKLFSSILIK